MSRTPFELIGSEDQALLAQDKWNRTTKGVFIICKGLVRGLDLKLGADAHYPKTPKPHKAYVWKYYEMFNINIYVSVIWGR